MCSITLIYMTDEYMPHDKLTTGFDFIAITLSSYDAKWYYNLQTNGLRFGLRQLTKVDLLSTLSDWNILWKGQYLPLW